MLCKHQEVFDEPCSDDTSRAIQCKVGYATTCMKHCNEACAGYDRVIIPKPMRYSAYRPPSAEEIAYRERIMQAQEDRMHGG